MFSNPVTPALELLTKRMEAGELKPRQFEMVTRELMRTAIFAYRTRPTPEEDAAHGGAQPLDGPVRGESDPPLPRPDNGL